MKARTVIWILLVVILLGVILLTLSRIGLIRPQRDPYDTRYMQALTEGLYQEAAHIAMSEAYQADNVGALHADAAWAFALSGDLENAELYAAIALEVVPENLRANCVMVLKDADADDGKAASGFFARQKSLLPQEETLLLAEGIFLYEQEQFAEAKLLLSDFLNIRPDFRLAQYLHADCCYWLGDYEMAMREYQFVIDRHPDDLDSQLGLAYCKFYAGDLPAAMAGVERILANQELPDAVYLNAQIAMEQENYEVAAEWFQKALLVGADISECHLQLAKAQRGRKDWLASDQNWRAWGLESGEMLRMEIELGMNDYLQGNVEAYENHLLTLMRQHPENVEVAYALGRFFLMETRYHEASEAMRKVLTLETDHEAARVELWNALFEGGLYEKCLQEVLLWTECHPEDTIAQGYLADCYVRLLQPLSAEKAYMQAWRLDLQNAESLKRLGALYLAYQQYAPTECVVQQIHQIYGPDADTKSMTAEIERFGKGSLAKRVQNRLEDSYLYTNKLPVIRQLTTELASDAQNNAVLVDNWMMSRLNPDDPFCFSASGEYYNTLIANDKNPSITVQPLPKALGKGWMADVDAFTRKTGNVFISFMEKQENTHADKLVFDLRGNGGGDIQSCVDMLDYLTGRGELVTLTNRDGYRDWVVASDADWKPFSSIILWTDKDTASSSELLILALRERLENVHVVGENTYGKGVAQEIYFNSSARFAMLATSHYWSVEGVNIHGKGIVPDIAISGDSNAYIKASMAQLVR